MTEFRGIRI